MEKYLHYYNSVFMPEVSIRLFFLYVPIIYVASNLCAFNVLLLSIENLWES